jgi:hypothetical protein
MIPQSTFKVFVFISSLVLLFVGEWALWHFLGGDPLVRWYMGGYGFLILLFLSMKLFLVKMLTKGGGTSSPQ